MKTFKSFSLFAMALAFLIAPLAAQTAPPAQTQQAEAAKAAEIQQQAAAARQQAQVEAAAKAQEDQRKRIEAERQKAEAERQEMEAVIKTYSLKFIKPDDVMKAAKFYAYDWTGSGSTITVRMPRKYVSEFEAVLKKLDIEKKNIQFQVYTVVASKDAPPDRYKSNFVSETRDVPNTDLRRVLDEMKGLWNFKYYWVDNPSFITVKDGSEGNSSKLVSSLDFEMRLRNIELRGDEPGKRNISAGGISLSQTGFNAGGGMERYSLIETSDITFKERGYLVVGVSGFRSTGSLSGAALILIISAEVK